jgi:hypothetical protein
MSRGSKTPPIVLGFAEGLIAPVVELVIGVWVTALTAIGSAMGTPNVTGFIALFSIVDVLRNIIACLLHTQFAIGNVIGNIFGIFLFYGSISSLSSEAANSSLLLTIILTISLIVGVCITIWRSRNSDSYVSNNFS